MVFRRTNGEIEWSCDACGDEGVISGWELDDACDLLVARAEGVAAGVVLKGRTGAFEELMEYVASEANAETDRRRVRLLDEACSALEAALAVE